MLEKEKLHPFDREVLDHKDIKLEPKERHIKEYHLEKPLPKKENELPHHKEEKHEIHLEHKEPIHDEIEMIIKLCGSKKELKEVMVYLYNLILDMPNEIKTETLIKKLK